jgi:hypothetical protein
MKHRLPQYSCIVLKLLHSSIRLKFFCNSVFASVIFSVGFFILFQLSIFSFLFFSVSQFLYTSFNMFVFLSFHFVTILITFLCFPYKKSTTDQWKEASEHGGKGKNYINFLDPLLYFNAERLFLSISTKSYILMLSSCF